MTLLIGFYADADWGRRSEFLECIRCNAANAYIDEILIFVEDETASAAVRERFSVLGHSKIRLLEHGRRLIYSQLFAFANLHLKGAAVIIANADIFFDETLALLEEETLAGRMLCLSRWDQATDGTLRHFDHPESQDAWIFEPPLPPITADFCLGKPGCDNRLAYEAERAGLLLSNPSRSVRARHLHNTGIRRYSERERLHGPTRLVPASFLEQRASPVASRNSPVNGFPSHRGFRTACLVNARYQEIEGLLKPHLEGVVPRSLRRELLRTLSNRVAGPARPSDEPLAVIAFREAMGYTLARLRCGVSSHNNDPRPLVFVPVELADLAFTQVVANHATPVEVEFRTGGRLFVLAAPGWQGYASAAEFLDDAGWRDSIEPLRTRDGTTFEVWSIYAEAGERLHLPTQVMLAAAELIQLDCGHSVSVQKGTEPTFQEKPEEIFVLTSLSPASWRVLVQRESICSWRRAGLRVCSLNHPSEIAALAPLYDVEWVPVLETSENVFGRHYIPIKAATDWAASHDCPVLITNADIKLKLTPWEMKRLRWLSDDGVCYFIRFNYDDEPRKLSREAHGIDAFLLHGSDAVRVPKSFLSIGQPFWDYLLPHLFASQGRPVVSVEFPATLHRSHPQQWSWENWRRCAAEFLRVTGVQAGNESLQAYVTMSLSVRESFDLKKMAILPQPFGIRKWTEKTFSVPGPKMFFELGSHRGTDTAWMSAISGVTVHAFEPDPRNHQPSRSNVIQHRTAISDRDGRAPFTLSLRGWGQEWTHSSSLKKPANHLARYPVTFGETIEVETISLDTFSRHECPGLIDFIWADIQGAEREMIRGGRETLARTRFLFTEYSDDELYEGQATLPQIMAMLPEFRVVELWPDDVLLENRSISK